MKRLAAYVIFAVLPFAPVTAQSFLDNPHLRESRRLQAQAEVLFEQGDYDQSTELAGKAKAESLLSDAWVRKETQRYLAYNERRRATDRLAQVENFRRAPVYQEEVERARLVLNASSAAYESEDYVEARNQALAVLTSLEGLEDGNLLPEYYVVRSLSPADCFWRISAYSFVFGDPKVWSKLYEANKHKLADPDNPDLIHPGLRLLIPSLNGEARSGDFDPRIRY